MVGKYPELKFVNFCRIMEIGKNIGRVKKEKIVTNLILRVFKN